MDKNENKNTGPFKITGNWGIQSEKLKTKYAQLTDEDLKFQTGEEIDLISRMSSRLNKNREEVITIINNA